jgi:dipeptidyl aminopeptidase/acylaminoacyl peptidase
MPWDATALMLACVGDDGGLHDVRRIAGAGESIQQPAWHADGTLYFISDRDGWWNLWSWNAAQPVQVTRARAELAGAPWVSGSVSYALCGREVFCAVNRDGRRQIERARLDDGRLEPLALPFTDVESLRAEDGRAIFIGASERRARAVVELDLDAGGCSELRASSSVVLDDDDIATPEALSFATGAGETAHAFWYAPRNGAFAAPASERPPVIVKCHGGPTSCALPALELRIQYWTTRGFALLDVNYRGSTGWGREYRERLYGGWGVVDVEDCVRAAQHVACEGQADGARALITGSSSGGYTVLCALVGYDAFRAGASHYGIGDLALLVSDTHKFESRYTQRLVGDDPAVWRERSPLHHADRIRAPVIFLQGLEDRVVPPEQSQQMAAALRARGVPVAYLEFTGEGHGFRRAETLRRALDAELYFHARVLGLAPAEPLEPVAIEPPLP